MRMSREKKSKILQIFEVARLWATTPSLGQQPRDGLFHSSPSVGYQPLNGLVARLCSLVLTVIYPPSSSAYSLIDSLTDSGQGENQPDFFVFGGEIDGYFTQGHLITGHGLLYQIIVQTKNVVDGLKGVNINYMLENPQNLGQVKRKSHIGKHKYFLHI